MSVKHMGNVAPYLHDTECRWCTGSANGVLSSTSFGSCVGLVLYGPRHQIGMVAHYSGSLGHPQHEDKVRADTQEILRGVCPVLPGIWDGWVFGGESLMENTEIRTNTQGQTRNLIDLVREEIAHNPYIPINIIASRRTVPEMQDGQYIGHKGVSLDLATGQVTWDDGVKKIVPKVKARRNSFDSKKTKLPAWL
jgi:hypothetical protein